MAVDAGRDQTRGRDDYGERLTNIWTGFQMIAAEMPYVAKLYRERYPDVVDEGRGRPDEARVGEASKLMDALVYPDRWQEAQRLFRDFWEREGGRVAEGRRIYEKWGEAGKPEGWISGDDPRRVVVEERLMAAARIQECNLAGIELRAHGEGGWSQERYAEIGMRADEAISRIGDKLPRGTAEPVGAYLGFHRENIRQAADLAVDPNLPPEEMRRQQVRATVSSEVIAIGDMDHESLQEAVLMDLLDLQERMRLEQDVLKKESTAGQLRVVHGAARALGLTAERSVSHFGNDVREVRVNDPEGSWPNLEFPDLKQDARVKIVAEANGVQISGGAEARWRDPGDGKWKKFERSKDGMRAIPVFFGGNRSVELALIGVDGSQRVISVVSRFAKNPYTGEDSIYRSMEVRWRREK